MGREDPIEFDIYLAFMLFFYFKLGLIVGVMGGMELFFDFGYLYLFGQFILIIRLNYLRENSIIFLESSNWWGFATSMLV